MGEKSKMPDKKRGFWDLVKEGSKGLGILFDVEDKGKPRRPTPSASRKPSSTRETSKDGQFIDPSYYSGSTPPVSAPPIAQPQHQPASEIIDDMMKNLAAERDAAVERQKVIHEHQRTALENVQPVSLVQQQKLDEQTELYLKGIQKQLGDIRRSQLESEQQQSNTPVIVENALEKFFYWVQERDNQQLDAAMKEFEQRLNSGQVEILMELRALSGQTEELILAEQRIQILEREKSQSKTGFRLMMLFFLLIIGGSAGTVWWLWADGLLRIQLFW